MRGRSEELRGSFLGSPSKPARLRGRGAAVACSRADVYFFSSSRIVASFVRAPALRTSCRTFLDEDFIRETATRRPRIRPPDRNRLHESVLAFPRLHRN